MKKFNTALLILSILGLLFSLVVIFFIDIDNFADVKILTSIWLSIVIVVLGFFSGFYFMLKR